MVFAVWAAPRAASRTGSSSSSTRSSRRCGSRAPSPSGSRGRRARRTATRPGSSPATSRSSATASGRASAPGCYTFLEMARDVGELDARAGAPLRPRGGAGVSVAARGEPVLDTSGCRRRRRSRRRSTASGSRDEDAIALLRSRDLVAVGRVANEVRNRLNDPSPGHVHRRPEPQLHERLRHRLRLLRLLPPPGRPARGLPPPEAGHLQEDRGDARASAAPASSCRAATTPTSGSTTTRISSARSRRATRSTCTRSRRPRSSTSRGARS